MLSTPQKLWFLLEPARRRRVFALFGLMVIGMLMETLGIGLVIPALALMTHGDIGAKYPVLEPWLRRAGNPTHAQLVIFGMLALVGIYAIKSLFLAFLAWRQARFTFELAANLSQRLFTGYLRQPYVFHLCRNSAQLIRNVLGQVSDASGVVQQGLTLATETLVVAGVSALLLAVEPVGAIVVMATLGVSGWAAHRVTRRHMLRWGEARQLHEGMRIQHLQQGLGGVKDVKLLGREEDFLNQYAFHNQGSARAGEGQLTLQAIPRLWLEFLAVAGLAVLVLIMIMRGKSLDALLPTLGLFAAAAFRLMPSVNRVLISLQTVRFATPVVDTLYSEFRLLSEGVVPRRVGTLRFASAVELHDLTFKYPGASSPALRGISLTVRKGESVGFIGTTGAGKSTLVDIILGLLTPDSGSLTIDGEDAQANLRDWQGQIGYVPQSIYLTDDTLKRNVAFGLANEQIDEQAVLRAVRAAQLEQLIADLPSGLDTVVGERGIRLSGGQRQRIGIARALYHDPQVLVLDEATSSLDTATERGVMRAVHALQGEKTVLIVAHRMSTVEHCDRLYRLESGRVINVGEATSVLDVVVSRAN